MHSIAIFLFAVGALELCRFETWRSIKCMISSPSISHTSSLISNCAFMYLFKLHCGWNFQGRMFWKACPSYNVSHFKISIPSGWQRVKEEQNRRGEIFFSSSVIPVFNLRCLSECLAPWWWEQVENIETLKEQIPSEYFKVLTQSLIWNYRTM